MPPMPPMVAIPDMPAGEAKAAWGRRFTAGIAPRQVPHVLSGLRTPAPLRLTRHAALHALQHGLQEVGRDDAGAHHRGRCDHAASRQGRQSSRHAASCSSSWAGTGAATSTAAAAAAAAATTAAATARPACPPCLAPARSAGRSAPVRRCNQRKPIQETAHERKARHARTARAAQMRACHERLHSNAL